jgi:uncharacterized protein YndB with AHSA1/START domain
MKDVGEMPHDEPIVVISRMLDAPRVLAWEAFTIPEHVAKWFGGEGFTSPGFARMISQGVDRLINFLKTHKAGDRHD